MARKCLLVVQLCLTLCDLSRLLCLWNSPGKNTGVCSHSLLQKIFLNQGMNMGFLHFRMILYCLSHQDMAYLGTKSLGLPAIEKNTREYHFKLTLRWFREDTNHFSWNLCIGLSLSIDELPWWLRWQRIRLQCKRPMFDPWVGKIPRRKEWLPSSVFLTGKFHGQKSFGGYSP